MSDITIPRVGYTLRLPHADSPFFLDYEINVNGTKYFGSSKHYFSNLSRLFHEYSEQGLHATLIIDPQEKTISADVCKTGYEPTGAHCFSISRFVTAPMVEAAVTSDAFIDQLEKFLQTPNRSAAVDRFQSCVSFYLEYFELYVYTDPGMLDNEVYDLVSATAVCTGISGSINVDLVASKLMALHGSRYLDGWLYLTFSYDDAVDFITHEFLDEEADE